jgi:hypothetical protein
MPYTTKELEIFLTELELPEAQRKAALEAIGAGGEKVLNRFGEHVLRQSDFSAKMDALTKDRERLEAEHAERMKKEDQFQASLATWKTEKEKEADEAMTKAREDSEARLRANAERIRALAATYGISENEIKDLTAAPAAETRAERPRDPNTGQYMTTDQFKTEAKFYARLPGIQLGLDREYYRLFGNDAPAVNWDKVIDEAQSNNRNLTAQFELTYKLSDKRAEITAAAHTKELADAEKRGAEAAMSKFYAENPASGARNLDRTRPGSPILDQARKDAAAGSAEAARQTAGGSQLAVEAATKAFQNGKYRDGKEQAA